MARRPVALLCMTAALGGIVKVATQYAQSVNHPIWSTEDENLPVVYRGDTPLVYRAAGLEYTLYFQENEISKLKWIPKSRWESDMDRYQLVPGPQPKGDHRVVWIKKMQTAGFYNPKTGEAVTFKGERNGATDMLVILHYKWNMYKWQKPSNYINHVVNVAGTDVFFNEKKLTFKPNEASEMRWIPISALQTSVPTGSIPLNPQLGQLVAQANDTTTSMVSPCVYDTMRRCPKPSPGEECMPSGSYTELMVAVVKHYPLFVRATNKTNGSPYVKEINLDESFKRIVVRDDDHPVSIHIPLVLPPSHLELSLRLPPYLPPRPLGTPLQMVIHLGQLVNTAACDTTGLTLYTSDARDENHFNECPRVLAQMCKFLCVCYKTPGYMCMLHVRFESPVYGKWDLPTMISGIKQSWFQNNAF